MASKTVHSLTSVSFARITSPNADHTFRNSFTVRSANVQQMCNKVVVTDLITP